MVKPGTYKHYKGKFYTVIGTGTHSESLEAYVIYQAQYDDPAYGPKAIWIRPLHSFLEHVTLDKNSVPRFEYIA